MCGWLKTSAKQEQCDTLQLRGSGSLFESLVAVVSAWSIVESALVARSCSTSARVLALLNRGKELTPSDQRREKKPSIATSNATFNMEDVLVRLKALEDASVELNSENARLLEASAKKRDDHESKRASEAALEAASNASDASGGRPAGHEDDGPPRELLGKRKRLAKVLAHDESLCGSSRATFVRFPAAYRGPGGVHRLSRSRCGRRFAGQPMVLRPRHDAQGRELRQDRAGE